MPSPSCTCFQCVCIFPLLKCVSIAPQPPTPHTAHTRTLYPCVTLPATYKSLNITLNEWYLATTLILTQFLLVNPTPSIVPPPLPHFLIHSPCMPPPTPRQLTTGDIIPHYFPPRMKNKLQFPAVSPSPTPPHTHTPPRCVDFHGLLIMHRSSQSRTTPRFPPPPEISLLHTHLHSESPPHPRAPSPTPSRRARDPRRARTHSHASLTSFPAQRRAGFAGTQPGPRGLGTPEAARSAASRGSPSSPRLPAGEGKDTATPPPPRIYHLCVCFSKPQPSARSL